MSATAVELFQAALDAAAPDAIVASMGAFRPVAQDVAQRTALYTPTRMRHLALRLHHLVSTPALRADVLVSLSTFQIANSLTQTVPGCTALVGACCNRGVCGGVCCNRASCARVRAARDSRIVGDFLHCVCVSRASA